MRMRHNVTSTDKREFQDFSRISRKTSTDKQASMHKHSATV